MNPVSDEAVMLQVREGQVGRLAVLFERHHRGLFNFFYRLGGNREQCEDLTQEVFMRILKYRRSFQPQASFTSWMFQIARHAHVDAGRKGKRELAWEEDRPEPASTEVGADESLRRAQEVALVRRALAGLPAGSREVLVLSRYHELKYEEIGQILGCEVGTVKARVYRAMRALSRAFAEMAGEPK
jgi:RNA polymerase sigma factor (sigma-70 family)